jgi:hypothetical protein
VVPFIGVVLQIKLSTSSSFRGTHKVFEILNQKINPDGSSPTHTTILNWVHKVGLHQLSIPKEKASDWIIILDHSVQIGKEKLLVVFGVRESKVDFSKPLQFQSLLPLWEESRETWNGESVKEILTELKQSLGNIKYAVADQGSDLKYGLKLAKIRHVYGITHIISNVLKKLYRRDKRFESFLKDMIHARNSAHQTGLAHLMPPGLRTKSRYENIGVISQWGKKIIDYVMDLPPRKERELIKRVMQQYGWVFQYEELLKELVEIDNAVKGFQKLLKNNGLQKNKNQTAVLGRLKSQNGKRLKEYLTDYFTNTACLIRNRKTPILCSSDIIESAFGKYKNYVSGNPMAGITNLVLCIAAFTSSLDEQEIMECLEKYTINDVKEWSKKHVGKSLFQKRKQCFEVRAA